MLSGVLAPPPIPSKWDIIPIHASDIVNFKRCRRYWDWSSPTRTNLRRKVHIFGLDMNLWFGTGIHYALERYYNPSIQHDPVETFLAWWHLQWQGGDVYEDELDLTYDLHPKQVMLHDDVPYTSSQGTLLYTVKGLKELHPSPNAEEFEDFKQLGIGMMTFYKEYAEREDDFDVVAAESQFSIPLGFESIDRREDSPNFGKTLEVHARGKRDAIIYRPSTGKYGIYDHKTAARVDESYFQGLENNPQFTTYMWASIMEAKEHGLPWEEVSWVCCNALRKVAPSPPTITSRGIPSINRNEEACTAEMFEQAVRENPAWQLWFDHDKKAQDYYEFLLTEGDKRFIQRDYATRNKYEITAAGTYIRMVAEEMLRDDINIYPSPSGDWLCLKCAFRGPCLAADDGSDWKGMLADGYEPNRDR